MEDGTNINLAVSNKFLANIPYSVIDNTIKSQNAHFNLINYQTPEISLGVNKLNFHGSAFQIPANIKDYNKEITFEYLMTSDWSQYKFLYKWLTKMVKEEGSGADYDKLDEVLIPIRVSILSEFINPIFDFVYHDCFIKRLGSIRMEYQNNAPVIVNSFTCAFSYFSIDESTQ